MAATGGVVGGGAAMTGGVVGGGTAMTGGVVGGGTAAPTPAGAGGVVPDVCTAVPVCSGSCVAVIYSPRTLAFAAS